MYFFIKVSIFLSFLSFYYTMFYIFVKQVRQEVVQVIVQHDV